MSRGATCPLSNCQTVRTRGARPSGEGNPRLSGNADQFVINPRQIAIAHKVTIYSVPRIGNLIVPIATGKEDAAWSHLQRDR